MITFHGKPELKEQLLNNLRDHAKADAFTQGVYFEGGKGCAVGCSIVDFGGYVDDHSEYERLFGIPRVIAKLEDGIFEGLSIEDSKWWPIAFAESIPVGVNLDLVFYSFMSWLLADQSDGVIRFARDKGKRVITDVANAMDAVANGEPKESINWGELRRSAYAAYAADATDAASAAAYTATYADADADADAAADAATYAYAADATDAAAAATYAATYAYAADATDAAAYAATYAYAADATDAAARKEARKKQALKLIEIMSQCG